MCPLISEKTTGKERRTYKASRKKWWEPTYESPGDGASAGQGLRFSRHFHTLFQRSLSAAWLRARQVVSSPFYRRISPLKSNEFTWIAQSPNWQLSNRGLKPKPSHFSISGFLFLFFPLCHHELLINGKKFIYWVLHALSLFYTWERIYS